MAAPNTLFCSPISNLYIPAGKDTTKPLASVFSHSLEQLVFDGGLRQNAVRALRNYLIDLDRAIVDACHHYKETNTDTESITYQNAQGYLRDSIRRRPLYIAIHALEKLLVNPNFFREYFILLVILLQFKDIAKTYVAPHTLQPVFARYFGNPGFYTRVHSFLPGPKFRHNANEFIQSEFSQFLVCVSYLNGAH